MRAVRLLGFIALFLLLPAPAWAWGPAGHLDLGLVVLDNLSLLAPATAALLSRFRDDFLYGSLAADITIGKNLSPYQLHCHNWQVGFSVLDLSPNDATCAFAWGYLAHLAADAVAHNYFVPYKTVEYYRRRGAAHTYWELRYDAQVPPAAWETGRRLATRAFAVHDRHLKRILTGPLFPFPVNKQIFKSMVQVSRVLRWRKMVKAHVKRTPRLLTEKEVAEVREMSIARIVDLLNRGAEADCLKSDPTGHRNLLIAQDLRKRLRSLRRQGRLIDPDDVGRQYRPLFREAIESKLVLPSINELVDPDKPAKNKTKNKRKPRGLLGGQRRRSQPRPTPRP